MTALELITAATQLVYAGIFIVVLRKALRRPTIAHVDMALFLGAMTLVFVQSRAVALLGVPPSRALSTAVSAVVLLMPYLLLRLFHDFSHVPAAARRAAEIGFVLSVALVAAVQPLPVAGSMALVAYFTLVAAYAASKFLAGSRRAHGVTRRRMEAIAGGTVFLALAVVVAGVGLVLPEGERGVTAAMTQVLALASGLSYYVGFAPPAILRRAWQEPELRAFLARAAELPRLETTDAIVAALEQGAAKTIGAAAAIGLLTPRGTLRYFQARTGQYVERPAGDYIGGRAFTEQRTIFSAQPAADDPEHADAYVAGKAGAIIATPIVAGRQRLGVLVVYAERPPIFAESDIELARLLADQAAVILESRALIDEAARVRAQEEATRLKDDFLSAAAHDLKTPLTTLVAQAQFLERKAEREPTAPMDRAGLGRIVREARRLNDLVLELLDVSRLEQGRLVGELEPVDLVELARQACERQADAERCAVDAEGPVVGRYDPQRMTQVFQNLVENALKYSAPAGRVRVTLAQHGTEARITVEDDGIGIPPEDLPHIFQRFHRGSNVDARRFTGMGLGLYIVKGIVEQHGGRIRAESAPGHGSAFHITLPAMQGRPN